MPIDFHDEKNKLTYTTRTADESWLAFIRQHIDVTGKAAADIGCGGGIYTKALAHLGASQVTGIDFSAEMLKGAAAHCQDVPSIHFIQGNAYSTGLPDNAFEVVLERALIHHLTDLTRCFQEANRILQKNGTLVVQDRTPQDCLLSGSEHHLRGYFFEKYPELAAKEISRRHTSAEVRRALESSGFTVTLEVQLWETRNSYDRFDALRNDLLQRTGRSILHELSDAELLELAAFIEQKLQASSTPIIEKDSWTIWLAIK